MISLRKTFPLPVARLILALAAATITACGGGGGGGTDGNPPPPVADVITTYNVSLDAANVLGGSTEMGTATAVVRHNSTDAQIEATVTLTNVTATSVSLRGAFAGSAGAEIYAFEQGATADQWTLSPQPFSANDARELASGSMYLLVATDANPDGAVRGQVLPQGVSVVKADLSPAGVPTSSSSAGAGTAWLTVNDSSSTIALHVQLENLAAADSGSLHRALAGLNGPALEALTADPMSNTHWSLDSTTASTDLLAALSNGELYIQFTTPDLPEGAIRGQYIPAGMELVMTDIRDDTVVMNPSSGPFTGTVGRMMTTIGRDSMTAVVNLFNVTNSASAELRQAPAGQNGPMIAAFDQDLNVTNRWIINSLPIDAVLQANLDNRTLYVSVSTATEPHGAARGQVETVTSSAPVDSSAFVVTLVDPMNAQMLDALPGAVFATLNREPLPESATPQAVLVEASGQDGSFGDGNETPIVPASISANGNMVEINLAGIEAADDVYRVMLTGGGAGGIVDMSGIALDGDSDGRPGGVYETAFEITKPATTATLTRIQNEIFSPSCATAGCHSGNNPPDGLLLTAGNSWSYIVNVDAVQQSLKRILPGDPDDSYLVRKVQGSGIVASRMPLGAAPLSQDQIDLIRKWVLEGAQNN